jgi:hypothetical protein
VFLLDLTKPLQYFTVIVTLETGDMPQCNRCFLDPLRQVAETPCQKKKIEIFKTAMGSCIKVVKQKKNGFTTETRLKYVYLVRTRE